MERTSTRISLRNPSKRQLMLNNALEIGAGTWDQSTVESVLQRCCYDWDQAIDMLVGGAGDRTLKRSYTATVASPSLPKRQVRELSRGQVPAAPATIVMQQAAQIVEQVPVVLGQSVTTTPEEHIPDMTTEPLLPEEVPELVHHHP